jgi:peptide/nickel transport system substrate-binding protein
MKKIGLFALIPMVLMVVAMLTPVISAGIPPADILYVGTIGWGPRRADPVRAYDTGSGELIFNSYDTLIQMANSTNPAYHVTAGMDKVDFEPYWDFEPMLATNVPSRVEVQRTFTETTYPYTIDIRSEAVMPPPPLVEPVCTWWEDDLAQPIESYHITSWNDTNANLILDPGDMIYLNDYWWAPTPELEVNLQGAGWWLVGDVQYHEEIQGYKLVLTYIPNLREVVRTEEYITYAPTYTLKKKPVETYSETLYNETTVLVRGVDYLIDYKTGLVTFLPAAPVMDYLADYSWIKTTTYPVSTVLTSTDTPNVIYFLTGWVDNNPDAVIGYCDVVYLMEYEILPVTWEKIGPGFKLVPITAHTWHIIEKTGTTWQLHYWYYDFIIRTDDGHGNPIYFVNETGDIVDQFNAYDAEYSYERGLVQDQAGSPMWMYYKPFFDQMNSDYWATGDPNDAIVLSWLIKDTVVASDATHLRIYLGIDFPDVSFKQILAQTWGAIVSKEWMIGYSCWDGNLFLDGDYADKNCLPDWFEYWRHKSRSPIDARHLKPPYTDPLDPNPTHWDWLYRYVGTGPYRVTVFDAVNNLVVLEKNELYWQGWPRAGNKADLNRVEISYIANWDARRDAFTGCSLDVCAVPRAYMMQILDPADPDYVKTLDPAIITIKNINPQLTMDAMHFTFLINPEATGYIYTGKFPDGVPPDFFNNTYVRKAFAYGFDWDTYLRDAYYDEAVRPFRSTPLVYGLVPDYYDASVGGYAISQAQAEKCLKAAVWDGTSVWDSGFHMALSYNSGNDQRRIACEMLKYFFGNLSTYDGRNLPTKPFLIDIKEIDWSTYLDQFEDMELPIFSIGWLADFADADNWVRPYMHSYGDFSYFQSYSVENGWGDTKDKLIDLAVKTPDGTARRNMYKQLQQIYIDDCPSFPIDQPSGRRFCKYYVKGWYYNGLYPSQYYYSMWKENTCWYNISGDQPGISDDVTNIFDINWLVRHFNGRQPDPSKSTLDPKWVGTYGCGGVDPRGDRVCNIFDINGAVRHFLHHATP